MASKKQVLVTDPDFGWIGTCARNIVREARDILGDVMHEMELLASPIIIRSHAPTESGFLWDDQPIRYRERVANKLVTHRVLRAAQHFHKRSPYVSDREREGFLVEADEAVVRQAHGLLQDRLQGRPRPAPHVMPPESPAAAATPPLAISPTEAPKRERIPRAFREAFLKGAGEHAGTWVTRTLIGLLLLLALIFGLRPLLHLLTQRPAP